MSNSNVLSFAAKGKEIRAKGDFLELIDSDIRNNPSCIQPIPAGIFDEIARIRRLAEENRQRELLEG